jgi:phage terminase small subunit
MASGAGVSTLEADKAAEVDRIYALYEKLTELEQRLLHHKDKGCGLTDSYLKACMDLMRKPGKYPHTASYDIFRRPKVQKYRQESRKVQKFAGFKSDIMSREEMAQRLTVLARGRIRDVIGTSVIASSDGQVLGRRLLVGDLEDMTDEQASLIREIKDTKDGISIKIYDSQSAMKQLSDIQGYNAPDVQEIHMGGGAARPDILLPDKEADAAMKALEPDVPDPGEPELPES